MSEAATSVNPGLSQPLLAKRTSPKWMISALLTPAIVALPVLSVIFLAFFPEENIWPHLIETTLPRYLTTTLKLMIGVGALTLVIGMVLVTNIITIIRLYRLQKKYPDFTPGS